MVWKQSVHVRSILDICGLKCARSNQSVRNSYFFYLYIVNIFIIMILAFEHYYYKCSIDSLLSIYIYIPVKEWTHFWVFILQLNVNGLEIRQRNKYLRFQNLWNRFYLSVTIMYSVSQFLQVYLTLDRIMDPILSINTKQSYFIIPVIEGQMCYFLY